MLYEADIRFLIEKWVLKAEKTPEKQYSTGVKDCVEDLRNLIDRIHQEEFNNYIESLTPEQLKEYCDEQEADYQLSSIEGQEGQWFS